MDIFSTVVEGDCVIVKHAICCILPGEYEDEKYMVGVSPQECPQV
jgi:hypothetical protein